MEKKTLNHKNDPPPPYYSSDLDIDPPLKPYKGEVYVVGLGPHYIPQYSPSVVGPETQLSKPPSSEKRRCCKSNARCYGGSGGVLLVLALLALAIWLGFRFGTQLVKVTIPDNNDGDDDHMKETPPLGNNSSCHNAVQCDGNIDCPLGTDEENCVRFSSTGLQVKTDQDHRYLPVCYHGWNQSYADKTCAQLGFQESNSTKPITVEEESIGLILTEKSSPFIQGILEVSSSCPDKKIVSLRCVDCGRQQSTSKIVGGMTAPVGRWPWQVSIQRGGSHYCGGILISHYFVLSAAHCFQGATRSNWKVYAGMVSLYALTKPYLVEKIIVNQNYNTVTNDNDIAILKLSSSVDFNETQNLLPACLPTSGKEFAAGTKCWTTGFGKTHPSGSSSKVLREVDVDITGDETCNSTNMYNGAITENMICAGYPNGGKDSCQGDSGGPLVCQENTGWSVVGITSWGESCAKKNRPGVYTKVSRFLPWIYRTMQQSRP